MAFPANLREQVIRRAGNRCEYCGLAQAGQEALFHLDHIVPRIAKGPTTPGNLALACVSCSLRKAARLMAPDPVTGKEVFLFNPRREKWTDHFRWEGFRVHGLTPTGRVTITALKLNRPLVIAIRREEALHGRFPPTVSS